MKQVPDARITNAYTTCQHITESTGFVNRIRQIFRSAQVLQRRARSGRTLPAAGAAPCPHSGLHISEKWSKNTPRGPVAQWSELAAHNRLVGGSSPPGPTTGFLVSFQILAAALFGQFSFLLKTLQKNFESNTG